MHREEREILEQSLLFLLQTSVSELCSRTDDYVFEDVRNYLEMALLQMKGSGV